MSFHINNIVKEALYHLRNIVKIRKYINVTTAEVLVQAFKNSKLDFCNSLLHGLPKYEIHKLQSALNASTNSAPWGGVYGLEEYNDEDFRLRFRLRKTRSLTS